MNSKEITPKNQTEKSANTGKETAKNEKPSWGKRFIEWTKKDKTFTDWCVAAFTCVLAGAAIYQFVIVGSQLDVMRKDQRAWMNVQIGGGSSQPEPGKPFIVTFTFNNSGKTPARNFYAVLRVEILDSEDGPTFDYSNWLLYSSEKSKIIVPNQQPPIQVGVSSLRQVSGTNTSEPIPITQELVNKFNAGRLWFAAEGKMSYDDIYGTKHWMTFCLADFHKESFMMNQPAGTHKCADYNHMDDK